MTTEHYPLSHNPDMRAGETTADFCRRMGYGHGTHLTGDEGFGAQTIIITAIGNRTILAHEPNSPHLESPWNLGYRHWKKTTP